MLCDSYKNKGMKGWGRDLLSTGGRTQQKLLLYKDSMCEMSIKEKLIKSSIKTQP